MKKYSIVALFLLLAVFGAVFFVEKNKNESAVNVPETITANTQTSTTTAPKKEVISTPGVILIGDRAKYENLSEEEKQLMGQYYTATTKDLKQVFIDQMPISGCYLKYYDAKTMMVGCVAGKPGLPLSLIEKKTWQTLQPELSCGINLWDGISETSQYVIAVGDTNICYFKAGDENIKNLHGAKLTSKNEGYVKIGGMANEYDFTFDEPSETFIVSIFKRDGSIDPTHPNQKLRTETFILP
jgi:hypothetical protein